VIGAYRAKPPHRGFLATADQPGGDVIDVLSWIWIAVATYGCGLALGRLTIGRTKPEMTEPGARGRAWYLCSFLTSIALAVLLLTGGWQPGRWLVTIAFVVILVRLTRFGLCLRAARRSTVMIL
jgi:hypothetical protein